MVYQDRHNLHVIFFFFAGESTVCRHKNRSADDIGIFWVQIYIYLKNIGICEPADFESSKGSICIYN